MDVSDLTRKTIERYGVSSRTVAYDIEALTEEWRKGAAAAIDEVKGRELAELDVMEMNLAAQFASKRDPNLIAARLALKKHRAELLGLYAPRQSEVTGRAGKAIEVSYVNDWRNVRSADPDDGEGE